MANNDVSQPLNSVVGKEEPSAQTATLAPQGIGMAVAFDWGLAVQTLVMPFMPYFFRQSASSLPSVFIIIFPLAAGFIFFFGESVRRGRRWARYMQLAFNSLGILGGIASLFTLYQSSQHGNYWPLVTTVILLIFSPLIVWRLSRPVTARWFATVSSADARKRHGGAWPWLILIWAIVGGVLQAIAASSR